MSKNCADNVRSIGSEEFYRMFAMLLLGAVILVVDQMLDARSYYVLDSAAGTVVVTRVITLAAVAVPAVALVTSFI